MTRPESGSEYLKAVKMGQKECAALQAKGQNPFPLVLDQIVSDGILDAAQFIGTTEISFGGNNFELYFEEDDFDKFADKLKECDVEYVHPVTEHPWGQRVVRFYDPDRHIIEVGENLKAVCRRFLDSGMTPEQTAERMDVPMKFVNACMR